VSKEDFDTLDIRMGKYLHTFNIVKIKVFSIDGTVVYSTESSIIGQRSLNFELKRALNGEVVSKLVNKEEVRDLAGEKRFDVDVVESYVPVFNDDGNIIGSFEVYLDITRYRDLIREFLLSSLIFTVTIMAIIFGFILILLLKGTDKLKMAHEQMENLASIDGLTNLFNRRTLMSRTDEEFARIKRIEDSDTDIATIGLLLIDIDHFKNINDTHGHLVGDEILKQLSKRILTNVRQYDIVGRYGGEEFLVIIPGLNINGSNQTANKIWSIIRDTPFIINDKSINITVSIGVSCLTPDDADIDDAIKRADDQLYKAKNDGRDRISSMNKQIILHTSL
jgi:diguanylate cyclase (GGDEF)-like protein